MIYDSDTGQYTSLQNIMINEAKNADTVDEKHYNNNWPTTLSNVQSACTNDFHNIGGTDNVNDADSDPINEIQTLSTNGNDITLLKDGGIVTPPYAINAHMVDGQHASSFAPANHSHPVTSSYYACTGQWNHPDGTYSLVRADLPIGESTWNCNYCQGWFNKHPALFWTVCWRIKPDGGEDNLASWSR